MGLRTKKGERTIQFALRLPESLHAVIKAMADAEVRSINGQIEFLLREQLKTMKAKKP